MNGYLNNLTLRTLNSGNRVEPRLPSFFEQGVFNPEPLPREEGATYEDEVTTIASPRQKAITESTGSVDPARRAQSLAGEATFVQPNPKRVETDDQNPVFDVKVVRPQSDEAKPVELVQALPSRSDVQAQKEFKGVEPEETEALLSPARSPVEPEFEEQNFVDAASQSVEPGGPRLSSMRDRVVDTKAAPGRRTPGRRQESRDPVSTQSMFEQAEGKTTTAIETARSTGETDSTIEEQNNTSTRKPEDHLEIPPASVPSFRRVNPSPPVWRDSREQPWRRRQPFAQADPEPIINVTIGRVEVRAEPANNRKTTSPGRSESAVMPLEDYLRKQRRGSDR